MEAVKVGTGLFDAAKTALDGLNEITGSTKNTLELLFAAFVAFKTANFVSTLAGIATKIGLIGSSAATATGETDALQASLGRLAIPALVITDALLLKKALMQQATAADVAGSNKSPYVKGSDLDALNQAGLRGQTGTNGSGQNVSSLSGPERAAYAAGLKANISAGVSGVTGFLAKVGKGAVGGQKPLSGSFTRTRPCRRRSNVRSVWPQTRNNLSLLRSRQRRTGRRSRSRRSSARRAGSRTRSTSVT